MELFLLCVSRSAPERNRNRVRRKKHKGVRPSWERSVNLYCYSPLLCFRNLLFINRFKAQYRFATGWQRAQQQRNSKHQNTNNLTSLLTPLHSSDGPHHWFSHFIHIAAHLPLYQNSKVRSALKYSINLKLILGKFTECILLIPTHNLIFNHFGSN